MKLLCKIFLIAIIAGSFTKNGLGANHAQYLGTPNLTISSEDERAMHQKLQDAINGKQAMYAITVTRTGSEVLTPAEIHTVFAVLHELFGTPGENHLRISEQFETSTDISTKGQYDTRLDDSFLETCRKFSISPDRADKFAELKQIIAEATNEYLSRMKDLDKIKSSLQLIVFNEYFFGGKVGFVNGYLEPTLYKYTNYFPNSIFYVNLLRQSLSRVSIFDLDRSISILSSPFNFRKMRESIESQYLMEQRHNVISRFTGVDSIIKSHNSIFPKLHQYEVSEDKTGNTNDKTVQQWISFLLNLKSQTCKQEFIYPCLENVSISIFREKPLTFYRKSTYANEFTKLTFANDASKWFLYLFGCGVDLLFNEHDKLAEILWQNISSEICLDLMHGVRSKDQLPRKIHIIQSNYIKLENCLEKMLPPCKYVLHADPHHANCYTFDKAKHKLTAAQLILKYSFVMNGTTYTIKTYQIP